MGAGMGGVRGVGGGYCYTPVLTGRRRRRAVMCLRVPPILLPSPSACGLWVRPGVHLPAGGVGRGPGRGAGRRAAGRLRPGGVGPRALFPSPVAAPPARVAWLRPSCRPRNLSPPWGRGQSIRTGRTRLSERPALPRSRKKLLQAARAGPG